MTDTTTPAAPKPRKPVRRGPPGVQCPGCNKLAGYDGVEVEVQGTEVGEDGLVAVEIRLVAQSRCCGEEIKEYNETGEYNLADSGHECPNADLIGREVPDGQGGTNTVEDTWEEGDADDGEADERSVGSGRFAKRYYIGRVNGTAKHVACGEEVDWTVEIECGAGDMEVLV
jgi:hypothetical protein